MLENSLPRSPKPSKYKNKRVEFLGMKFDSIGERDRYICLFQDEKDGNISDLQRQVKFPLTSNGIVVCDYISDFVYTKGSIKIVEDFKGFFTDTFHLKAKMFKARYWFDITITRRKVWKSLGKK